jgi:hypothetical protein
MKAPLFAFLCARFGPDLWKMTNYGVLLHQKEVIPVEIGAGLAAASAKGGSGATSDTNSQNNG